MAKFLRIKNVVLNVDEIMGVTVNPNQVLNAHGTLGISEDGYKMAFRLRNSNDVPSFLYDTEEEAMDALWNVSYKLDAVVVSQ